MKTSKETGENPSPTRPELETNGNGSDASAAPRTKRSPRTRREPASVPSDDSPAGEHSDVTENFDKPLILKALIAARNGDFSSRLPSEWTGLDGKIADTFNEIMLAN